MYRFVAFVWNPADSEAAKLAARLRMELHSDSTPSTPWRLAINKNGLSLSYAGHGDAGWQLHRLADDGGVILGSLFECQDGRSSRSALRLSTSESRSIVSSRGAHLVSHYWGRYVAFLYDEATHTQVVLRDPLGHVPCFCVRHSTVWIYFSWLPDVLPLGVATHVDWQYVSERLTYRSIHSDLTGLIGVSQLLGGQSAEHRGEHRRTVMHWDPQEVARRRTLTDPALAAKELARVTRDVVRAWADSYPSLMLALSGGFDSSVLLACCSGSPAKIVCVNKFTEEAAGDERVFARRAARKARCELLEVPAEADLDLGLLDRCPAHPEPINGLAWLDHWRYTAPLALERGAPVLLCGDGGDEIFLRWGLRWAVVDFVRDHGIGLGAVKYAMDAARMDGESMWSMLRAAIGGRRWTLRDELSSAAVVNGTRQHDARFAHPAFAGASTSAGKFRHAFLVSTVAKRYDPVGTGGRVDELAPLCSQPLVELCLQIPTYLLMQGGWDRALARRAFQTDLPRQIVARRTKGGVNGWLRGVMVRNAALLRSRLIDGQLVKQGMVDPTRIDQILALERSREPGVLSEIYDLLNVETWLHSFRAATQPASSVPPQASSLTLEHQQ